MDTLLNTYLVVMTLVHGYGVVAIRQSRNVLALVINAVLFATTMMLLAERLL